jgi:two-component system, NarL family, sensor histidine kinase UhpB
LLKTDVAVVLMDVSMPDVDGFELADVIRQHPRFQKTAIICATANGNRVSWLDYVHPDDIENSKSGWKQSVHAGAQYESEYRLRSRDGAYRWFRARAVPIRSPEGKIVKWYGTCSDIQDSKLLEQSIRDNAVELEKMVDKRTDELRRLSVRLMSAQDQERRRIARDLHDGLGQELAVAKMILDKMLFENSSQPREACAQASSIIDRAIQQVRTMSHLLHPPLLDEVGLLSALAWYAEGLTKRSGIEVLLDVQPPDFPRLAPEVETAVFRIVQEALTNVFRHAEARKVWITLHRRDGSIVASVLDDGKGIDPRIAELRPEKLGVGIGGMNQRAREFGGELRLRSANPGTLLELMIPASSVVREPSAVLNGCA